MELKILKNGVQWITEYHEIDCTESRLLKGSPAYGAMNRLLYKYTRGDLKNIRKFVDGLPLFDLLVSFHNSCESPLQEDGSFMDCAMGYDGFVKEQRVLFLYLLLKCKYSHKQCLGILDYYDSHVSLDYYDLLDHFHLEDNTGHFNGDWISVADRMEQSMHGKETPLHGFLGDVMLKEQYAGK